MIILKWAVISPYAEHKIGYSLAEHAQRLVFRWLSMLESWLLIG
jgi:hypothetical protein